MPDRIPMSEKGRLLKEKLVVGKNKLVVQAKKFKPKLVLSKLREDGPAGLRRSVWGLWIVFLYYQGWSIYSIIRLALCVAAFLYIALPFIFKFTPYIQRNLVFLPFVRWPKNVNFDDPDAEGLPGTRNFYLESEPGVKIGVWHTVPQYLINESKGKDADWFEKSLRDDDSIVILYLHGNTAHRAGGHRLELYKVLRGQQNFGRCEPLSFHVVSMDYRGYADSTQMVPNETGVVSDARAVFQWLLKEVGSSCRILVWGHSLGTGVSSHLVADLCVEGSRPCGLILESPFNNIFDEIRNHPMAWAWRKIPWFDWFFTEALAKSDLGFVSDQRILLIDIPVLILHAEDDAVVPHKLGKALHGAAVANRSPSWPEVEFISFTSDLGYAHKYIYLDKELPDIIRRFEARCKCRNDVQ